MVVIDQHTENITSLQNVNSLVTLKGPIHLEDSLEQLYLAGRFFVVSMTWDPAG